MEHGHDELTEQRRKKQLTPAGRELLEEIERMATSSEPLSEETLARVNALPPSDQAELLSILGEKVARGEEGHKGGRIWQEAQRRPSVKPRSGNWPRVGR